MAKISTYVIDGTIVDDDKVIGSDANNDLQTKNYRMGDLVGFFAASIGNDYLVPYIGANDNVDLGAFDLSATNITISGNFIADGTEGLPGQALLSQGPGSPSIWGYVTGSQDLASVLNIGNLGGRNINLNTINGYARIDVEKIYGEPAMYLYSDALDTTSSWAINKLHLEDVPYEGDYFANKIRYTFVGNYVDLILNSYNNQSFILPAVGGFIPVSVNGNFSDASGNINVPIGGGGTVTNIDTSAPLTGGPISVSGTIGITQSGITTDGYLSSTDWNTFDGKQDPITLTTTGTSGAATFIGNVLNVPDYSGGSGTTPNLQQVTDVGGNTTQAISIYFDASHYINIVPFNGSTLNSEINLLNSTVSYGYANGLLNSTFDEIGDYKDCYLIIQMNNVNTGQSKDVSIGTVSSGVDIYSNIGFTDVNTDEKFGFTTIDGFSRIVYSIPNGIGGTKGSILDFQSQLIQSQFFPNSLAIPTTAGIYLDFASSQYYIGDTNYFVKVDTSIPNTTISTLSGTGTRMVVADASGVLSTQTVPTSGITGTGTATQVAFWDTSSSLTSSSNLFWDATNNYLGVNVATPLYNLDVFGSANIALDNVPGPYLTNKFSVRNGMLRLGVDADLTYGSRFIQFTDAADTQEYFSFNTNTAGNPQFSMANAASFSINSGATNYGLGDPKLTVLANGNVGIGTDAPQVRLHVSQGTPGAMAFPYEAMVVERNGDTKFGVYTSTTDPDAGGGASYVLGATNILTETFYYPGFEYQLDPDISTLNNKVRYNYIGRNSLGEVRQSIEGLLNIVANGTVSVNGASGYITGIVPQLLVGLDTSANAFDVQSTLSSRISKLGGGGTQMVVADNSGVLGVQAIPAGTVTGSGTTNYIPKWSSSTALADSLIFDNGTNVGIGTASPAYKLDISGSARVGSATSDKFYIASYLQFDYGNNGDGVNESRMFSTSRIHLQSNATSGIRTLIGTLGTNAYTDVVEAQVAIGDFSVTTGTKTGLKLTGQLLMASGSTIVNYADISPFFNMVGSTYSGTVRGIYYNPTVGSGSITPPTHIAYQNTSGDIIHGNLATGGADQMVTADTNGKLKIQTIPSGGGGTVTSVAALTLGTTGTDLSSTVANGTTTPVITLNVPDASATARGVVTTGAQTLAGAKTFSTAPILSSLTASQVLALDGSGNVQSLAVATYPSLTELSYVKGVTSAIQTQINSKQATLTNPVTGTGTNNEIAYFNTTGSTIASLPTATYPSLTELSYVKGVTSAIQTQINGKVTDSAWVDYSATSTIVGFTAYATKLIQYRLLGNKTMIVQFQIESTALNGSGTASSFTLPFNASTWGTQYFIYHSLNNTTTQNSGIATLAASSNVVNFYPTAATGSLWTTATTRWIQGQIIVNIA